MFKVTMEPLNAQAVNDLVKRPTDGAVVTFDGIVRNNFDGRAVQSLEYEAYAEMAEKKMAQIGQEVRRKFPVGEIAMMHRLGRLDIGESSIVIAVAAPHRHEAFEACAYAMDRIKEEVPIWKKELFADGDDHWANQN